MTTRTYRTPNRLAFMIQNIRTSARTTQAGILKKQTDGHNKHDTRNDDDGHKKQPHSTILKAD